MRKPTPAQQRVLERMADGESIGLGASGKVRMRAKSLPHGALGNLLEPIDERTLDVLMRNQWVFRSDGAVTSWTITDAGRAAVAEHDRPETGGEQP